MRLLTFLKTLNEGIMDAMIETAIPEATNMLRDAITSGEDDGGTREWFAMHEYGGEEPSDSYEEVERKYAEWLDRWCVARVENAADEMVDGMSYNRHAHMSGIVVYRIIRADEDFPSKISDRGLGEYWSWEEGAAEAHWAGHGNTFYLMVGLVDPKHVNWEQSLFQNAHPNYEHEKELFIPQGSGVELYKLLLGNGDEVDPQLYGGRQRLQASTGITEARVNVPQRLKDMVVWRLLSELDEVAVQELHDQFTAQYDDEFGPTYEMDEAYNTWVKQWAKATVESSLRDIAALMEYEDGGINVYRAMKGDDDFMNNMKSRGLGTYWSWARSGAVPYWGDLNNGGGTTYVIKGRVKPNAIDLDDTLFQNSHPTYHQELEATLKRGADVEVLEVYADGQVVDANPHKSYGMMTASIGESEIALSARFARTSELRESDDRLARAEAMGFDTSVVWYHGTTHNDIEQLSGDRGVAVHLTRHGGNASGWADQRAFDDAMDAAIDEYGDDLVYNDVEASPHARQTVYLFFIRVKNIFDIRRKDHRAMLAPHKDGYSLANPKFDDYDKWDFEILEGWSKEIQAAGFDSYWDFEKHSVWTAADSRSSTPSQIAVFDARNIRSVNAQFADDNSRNIMASVGDQL